MHHPTGSDGSRRAHIPSAVDRDLLLRGWAADVFRYPQYRVAAARHLQCTAELTRATDPADAQLWMTAAEAWEALKAAHPLAYCQFRQAEALLAGRRPAGSVGLSRSALGNAVGHRPLTGEIRALARRARIPSAHGAADAAAAPLVAEQATDGSQGVPEQTNPWRLTARESPTSHALLQMDGLTPR